MQRVAHPAVVRALVLRGARRQVHVHVRLVIGHEREAVHVVVVAARLRGEARDGAVDDVDVGGLEAVQHLCGVERDADRGALRRRRRRRGERHRRRHGVEDEGQVGAGRVAVVRKVQQAVGGQESQHRALLRGLNLELEVDAVARAGAVGVQRGGDAALDVEVAHGEAHDVLVRLQRHLDRVVVRHDGVARLRVGVDARRVKGHERLRRVVREDQGVALLVRIGGKVGDRARCHARVHGVALAGGGGELHRVLGSRASEIGQRRAVQHQIGRLQVARQRRVPLDGELDLGRCQGHGAVALVQRAERVLERGDGPRGVEDPRNRGRLQQVVPRAVGARARRERRRHGALVLGRDLVAKVLAAAALAEGGGLAAAHAQRRDVEAQQNLRASHRHGDGRHVRVVGVAGAQVGARLGGVEAELQLGRGLVVVVRAVKGRARGHAEGQRPRVALALGHQLNGVLLARARVLARHLHAAGALHLQVARTQVVHRLAERERHRQRRHAEMLRLRSRQGHLRRDGIVLEFQLARRSRCGVLRAILAHLGAQRHQRHALRAGRDGDGKVARKARGGRHV
mmetsp:Transcript_3176/g.9877  ORF Transcript_3176/g.9877 Transcript_3176/m.9877 type:complete len:570 (-) Transcript_3176:825-2534(-)